RQLRAAEELLDRSDHGTDIDQRLRRDHIRILNGHSLTHDALHPRQADTELILQQFTYGTQTTVTQMIDVIRASNPMQQIHKIIDRGNNISRSDMLYTLVD